MYKDSWNAVVVKTVECPKHHWDSKTCMQWRSESQCWYQKRQDNLSKNPVTKI